jgi:predicted RNase H-like nuclease (RuvC/YqgF family)
LQIQSNSATGKKYSEHYKQRQGTTKNLYVKEADNTQQNVDYNRKIDSLDRVIAQLKAERVNEQSNNDVKIKTLEAQLKTEHEKYQAIIEEKDKTITSLKSTIDSLKKDTSRLNKELARYERILEISLTENAVIFMGATCYFDKDGKAVVYNWEYSDIEDVEVPNKIKTEQELFQELFDLLKNPEVVKNQKYEVYLETNSPSKRTGSNRFNKFADMFKLEDAKHYNRVTNNKSAKIIIIKKSKP